MFSISSEARRRSVTSRRTDTMPPSLGPIEAGLVMSSKSRSRPSAGSTSGSSRELVSGPVRASEAEKSRLLSATARRRPSLLSSPTVSSRSAEALATRMRPSGCRAIA